MSHKIKLHRVKEGTGQPIGRILLDLDSIESVEEYNVLPPTSGSIVRMKAVFTGFYGDGDAMCLTQTEYHVSESFYEIERLLGEVQKPQL